MIALTKLSETASTITLGWTPVSGGIGYRFTSEKQSKPSHTWDASKSSVKFAKGSAWYKVEVLGVEDEGTYPQSNPPPLPGALIWSGDNETGNDSQWDGFVSRAASDRWRVTGPTEGVSPRSGNYMARVECRQGEPTPWGSSLSATLTEKHTLPVGEGKTYPDTYLRWAAWIPSDWPWADASMHSTFMEWHGDGSMSQAPFHWCIYSNGSNAGRFGVDLHRAVTGYSPVFQVAFERLSDPGVADAWHDYKLRILWSQGSGGRFQFWRNDVLQYDYSGPTAPISGESLKLQAGIYCRNGPPATKRIFLDEISLRTG